LVWSCTAAQGRRGIFRRDQLESPRNRRKARW
jgi:hypothetical protein